jgi:hypothetical protein
MTLQEWQRYLLQERRRKLKSIDLLSSGSIGTHEMRDGKRIDTTNNAIAIQREHVLELEKILAEAGIPLDA